MYNSPRAEPLFEQALQIRRKALGPEHPGIARSLHNLALLYVEMGDYARPNRSISKRSKSTKRCWGPTTLTALAYNMTRVLKIVGIERLLKVFKNAENQELFDSVFTLC